MEELSLSSEYFRIGNAVTVTRTVTRGESSRLYMIEAMRIEETGLRYVESSDIGNLLDTMVQRSIQVYIRLFPASPKNKGKIWELNIDKIVNSSWGVYKLILPDGSAWFTTSYSIFHADGEAIELDMIRTLSDKELKSC